MKNLIHWVSLRGAFLSKVLKNDKTLETILHSFRLNSLSKGTCKLIKHLFTVVVHSLKPVLLNEFFSRVSLHPCPFSPTVFFAVGIGSNTQVLDSLHSAEFRNIRNLNCKLNSVKYLFSTGLSECESDPMYFNHYIDCPDCHIQAYFPT